MFNFYLLNKRDNFPRSFHEFCNYFRLSVYNMDKNPHDGIQKYLTMHIIINNILNSKKYSQTWNIENTALLVLTQTNGMPGRGMDSREMW